MNANAADIYQFDDAGALLETHLPLPRRSGKVRDVYEINDSLLIVSTDRISAFDYIMPSGIREKGNLLTAMSQFWFEQLEVRHHLITTQIPASLGLDFNTGPLEGRVMLTKKAAVVPFECVVRGYLEGSGWREYQATGKICGNELPAGLTQCDPLPQAIFTPATKAEEGHDENVSIDRMIADIGEEMAFKLRDLSLEIYRSASQYAAKRGIIIADTKFEFGIVDGEIILIDEVLTPDSSRFWAADDYQPGRAQVSFDKQFLREWLTTCGWDQQSPPPKLPPEVIEQTRAKYQEAFHRLTAPSGS